MGVGEEILLNLCEWNPGSCSLDTLPFVFVCVQFVPFEKTVLEVKYLLGFSIPLIFIF